jgi:hypothetical protein
LLDHVIVLNDRTHLALEKRTPAARLAAMRTDGSLRIKVFNREQEADCLSPVLLFPAMHSYRYCPAMTKMHWPLILASV